MNMLDVGNVFKAWEKAKIRLEETQNHNAKNCQEEQANISVGFFHD
jgi:hypothetical protein